MKIYGVGRVAKDFEIDYSPKGICILKFPFAENIFDRKTKEKKAQYYNVHISQLPQPPDVRSRSRPPWQHCSCILFPS